MAVHFTCKKRREATNPQDTDNFQHSECSLGNYTKKERWSTSEEMMYLLSDSLSPGPAVSSGPNVSGCILSAFSAKFLKLLWGFCEHSRWWDRADIFPVRFLVPFCRLRRPGSLSPSCLTLQLLQWEWPWWSQAQSPPELAVHHAFRSLCNPTTKPTTWERIVLPFFQPLKQAGLSYAYV